MPRLTTEQRAMYAEFGSYFPTCWNCGWREGKRSWCYPRRVEIAHIIGGPGRRADRRDIVRLCTLCHRRAHNERIVRLDGQPLPPITLAGLLWLKKEHDPTFYDRKYLQSLRIKRGHLPNARRPLKHATGSSATTEHMAMTPTRWSAAGAAQNNGLSFR